MYFAEIEIQDGNRRVQHVLHDPHTEESVLSHGRITHAVNTISDFRFEMLPGHPLFETDLPAYLSWVTVRDKDNNIIFRGRVIDLSRQMGANGIPTKAYVAECELAYLLDSIQRVRDFQGRAAIETPEFLRIMLDRHNGRVEVEKSFHRMRVNDTEFSVDTTIPRTVDRETLPTRRVEYATTFENIKENLLDHVGGYIWIEYRDNERIFCYQEDERDFWNKSTMPIALAENLESVRSERVSTRAITRIIPLGIELNTPENAIRRLVAAGIINNDDFEDGRDYGENVEWWKQNYDKINDWMFRLLLELSRLNYLSCRGPEDACDYEACDPANELEPLFDDPVDRFDDENNVRNPDGFSKAVDLLAGGVWPRQVRAIRYPDYWKEAGRTDLDAEEIAEIENEDERVYLMRIRWLIRKAARDFTKCRPRLFQVDELDARLNLGNPNWIDVDMELAIQRLHIAGIMHDTEFWTTQYETRFQRATSSWTATLIIALSALNYDPILVSQAREAVGGETGVANMMENKQAQLHEGIDRLASLGTINNPDYWKELSERIPYIAALLWMTGQSVDMGDPRSPYFNSSRNLFGTTVEKVLIFDNVTDCNELWQRGIDWIRNRNLPMSMTLSALDLSQLDASYEQFQVGWEYRVENPLLDIGGIEAYRLTQQTIDLLNPLKSTLTFGDRDISMTSNRSRAFEKKHKILSKKGALS